MATADRFRNVILSALVLGCGDDRADIQEPPPVASVSITAPATSVEVGQTVQLTATAHDADGGVLDGRSFEWASTDGGVASVSPEGLVTALAEGRVDVLATTEDVVGAIEITVTPLPSEPPPPPPPPPPPGPPGAVGLELVAEGLGFPVGLTSPPDDERLFILDKGGAIRVVKEGRLLETPFLDLTGQVGTRREQGLLGMAFPPDYATSGRFIVHYTDAQENSRVSSFRVSGDPDRADPASESVVITAEALSPAHNGGQILFGPDGYLYISLGDGGSMDGDDRGRAQSLEDLHGSILRIDVTSGSGYTVPADNPFVGRSGARPEIWSYGLRNPWRFSFDRATGDLYIADVGERRWEEVNRSPVAEGAGRGANFGWSLMEGNECYPGRDCDAGALVLPVLQYDHTNGCSVTGGYVYRGAAVPALQAQYLFADFCHGWVRSFRVDGDPTDLTEWNDLRPGGGIPSLGEDASGELYVLNTEGKAFRIVQR